MIDAWSQQSEPAGPDERAIFPELRERDWSVLMARAQEGDEDAYLELLQQILPYLRRRTAGCFRTPEDSENAIQDILVTIHAVRQTYDPARSFGTWLAGIADRRMLDRASRLGQRRNLLAAQQHTIGLLKLKKMLLKEMRS